MGIQRKFKGEDGHALKALSASFKKSASAKR